MTSIYVNTQAPITPVICVIIKNPLVASGQSNVFHNMQIYIKEKDVGYIRTLLNEDLNADLNPFPFSRHDKNETLCALW